MAASSPLILFFSFLLSTLGFASALAAAATQMRSYLVLEGPGANKGKGYALWKRFLSEHHDTHVSIYAAETSNGGREAKESLLTERSGAITTTLTPIVLMCSTARCHLGRIRTRCSKHSSVELRFKY